MRLPAPSPSNFRNYLHLHFAKHLRLAGIAAILWRLTKFSLANILLFGLKDSNLPNKDQTLYKAEALVKEAEALPNEAQALRATASAFCPAASLHLHLRHGISSLSTHRDGTLSPRV
jgi:hypothetical protein